MDARRRGVGGWAAWTLVVFLAIGGAASRPAGWLLGWPGALAAVAVVAGGLVLARWAGADTGALGLGLAGLPLLLLVGVAVPGLRALSGPPLLAPALAVLALALARVRPAAVDSPGAVPGGAGPLFARGVAGPGAGRPAGRRAPLPHGGAEPARGRGPGPRKGLRRGPLPGVPPGSAVAALPRARPRWRPLLAPRRGALAPDPARVRGGRIPGGLVLHGVPGRAAGPGDPWAAPRLARRRGPGRRGGAGSWPSARRCCTTRAWSSPRCRRRSAVALALRRGRDGHGAVAGAASPWPRSRGSTPGTGSLSALILVYVIAGRPRLRRALGVEPRRRLGRRPGPLPSSPLWLPRPPARLWPEAGVLAGRAAPGAPGPVPGPGVRPAGLRAGVRAGRARRDRAHPRPAAGGPGGGRPGGRGRRDRGPVADVARRIQPPRALPGAGGAGPGAWRWRPRLRAGARGRRGPPRRAGASGPACPGRWTRGWSTGTGTGRRRCSGSGRGPRSGRACCPATSWTSRRGIAAGWAVVWTAALAAAVFVRRRRPATAWGVAGRVPGPAGRRGVRLHALAGPHGGPRRCPRSLGRPALSVPGMAQGGGRRVGRRPTSPGARSTSRTGIRRGRSWAAAWACGPGGYRLVLGIEAVGPAGDPPVLEVRQGGRGPGRCATAPLAGARRRPVPGGAGPGAGHPGPPGRWPLHRQGDTAPGLNLFAPPWSNGVNGGGWMTGLVSPGGVPRPSGGPDPDCPS